MHAPAMNRSATGSHPLRCFSVACPWSADRTGGSGSPGGSRSGSSGGGSSTGGFCGRLGGSFTGGGRDGGWGGAGSGSSEGGSSTGGFCGRLGGSLTGGFRLRWVFMPRSVWIRIPKCPGPMGAIFDSPVALHFSSPAGVPGGSIYCFRWSASASALATRCFTRTTLSGFKEMESIPASTRKAANSG